MQTPIDTAVYADLQESTGAEFVTELVQTFLEEAPRTLAELEAALKDAAPDRFRRAAHSLKTNALTFGATQLAAQARDLELGGLPADASGLATVRASYAAAAAALQELSRG
jgi:HPt (histidine-containing phosphotransfer) domain-containing protein